MNAASDLPIQWKVFIALKSKFEYSTFRKIHQLASDKKKDWERKKKIEEVGRKRKPEWELGFYRHKGKQLHFIGWDGHADTET